MSKRVSRRSRKSRRGNLMLAKPTTVEGLEPRLLMSAAPHGGYWLLRGTSGDDTIVVQEDPADASQLQAWRNGDLLATANKSAVRVLRINGGRGDDQITVNLPAEDNIKCVLEGGAGNDTLVGSDGRDVLFGGIGRDNLSGGAGDDVLWGGTGNDILDGGAGDDRLYGGAGDDVLKDPEGVDLFNPGRGKDIVYGDAGEDKFQTSKTDLRMGAGSQSAPLLGETAGDLRDRLIQQALEQNQNLFGQAYQNYWWPICYACDGLAKGGALSFSGPVASLAAASGVTSQATDHSNTNTQVAGVDEADIVENDGNYLYVISGQELLILKAWPADQTQIVSRTPLGGYGAAMYLDGDRLTVITNTGFSSGGGGGGGGAGRSASCP